MTYYLAGTAESPFPVSNQFKELVSSLSQKGFTLVDTFPSDFFISINHNPKKYREFIRSGGVAKNSALVMLEPKAVYPSQYRTRIQKCYALVLAPGHFEPDKSHDAFIPWPYEYIPTGEGFDLRSQVLKNKNHKLFEFSVWSERKYFLTMVNANKVSSTKEENYGLRRVYAKQIDARSLMVFGDLWESSISSKIQHRFFVLLFSIKNFHFPNLFHIYGNLHWKYSTSRGAVDDKQEILQLSKFSLVIENDDSYVSEKLIDSLMNGSIPIYRGPQLPSSIIPNDVYIALPESPDELMKFLETLQGSEIQSFLDNIQAFVQSKNFISRWERKIVFRQIAAELVSCFGDSDE
jgi:hypothetical protein